MTKSFPAIAVRKGGTKPIFVSPPPSPDPGPGEVLCRTLELGICGTDREIVASGNALAPHDEPHLVLGHECLARVEVVGAGVEDFQVGDFVVPTVRRPLRPTKVRTDMLAPGEYVERGIVHAHGFSRPLWGENAEFLLPIGQFLTPIAVFLEPQAVAEKAINEAIAVQRGRFGPEAWRDQPPRVLITGLGPIAFAALLAARLRDFPATVCGRDEDDTFRARLVREFGGEYAASARLTTAAQHVERDGFDLLIECTGSDEVMFGATQALASRGVSVWLAAAPGGSVPTREVGKLMMTSLLRNHVHLGAVNASPRDFHDGISHLTSLRHSHPEALNSLITQRVHPDSSLAHFERRQPQGIKVVVVYDQ